MDSFKLLNNQLLFICVSKYHTIEEIKKSYYRGFKNFGENKLQDLEAKKIALENEDINDITWHFIGRIQSNKIKKIVKYSDLIHSVSNQKHLEKINLEAKNIDKVQNILLQINLTDEDTKDGFKYKNANNCLKNYKAYKNINISGIMIIGPHTDSISEIQEVFKEGRKVFEDFQILNPNVKILSMGMSNDYEIALVHKSNCIRIGSKFFESLNE